VLCAVTIPPADLRSLSSYCYAVCGLETCCSNSINVVTVLFHLQMKVSISFKL